MGSSFTVPKANFTVPNSRTANAPSSEGKASSIIECKTKAQWSAHYEASRGTNKLDVAREYGVEAMPTFVLVKNGKAIDKVVGARKDDL